MKDDSLSQLARNSAKKYGLDPALVCAVVEQESAWNPWAIRYEERFYVKYVLGGLTDEEIIKLGKTELQSRAFSWGLMQVMGLTARVHGFNGRFLSELCRPQVGLEVGCQVLQDYLHEKEGYLRAALRGELAPNCRICLLRADRTGGPGISSP